MKNLFFVFFIFIAINGFSQNENTNVRINYIEDENLNLINELNGIKILSITCSDTTMLNKYFFLSIDEYRLGKLTKSDSLGLTCEVKQIPMIVGSDTMIYEFNMCDRIMYNDINRSFNIILAGKFDNDSLNLILKYPSFSLNKKLTGSVKYVFREVISTDNGEFSININKRTPILAYTNPFESETLASYCLLDGESPINWYEKFNIKHFYIFCLEIK